MRTHSANPNIIPVATGLPYVGEIPAIEGVGFEFSATGPDLRLFYPDITSRELFDIRHGDIYLGVLRFKDLAIVPWRIGDSLQGDAQFHVGLNPEGFRPDPRAIDEQGLEVAVIGIDTISRFILAARPVMLSERMTELMRRIVAGQLAHPIAKHAYDAQVRDFQRTFQGGAQQVIDAAEVFEKTTPALPC